jgi:uncharacterized membrane protein
MDQVVEGTPLGKCLSRDTFDVANCTNGTLTKPLPVTVEALTQSFVMILVSEIGTSLLCLCQT